RLDAQQPLVVRRVVGVAGVFERWVGEVGNTRPDPHGRTDDHCPCCGSCCASSGSRFASRPAQNRVVSRNDMRSRKSAIGSAPQLARSSSSALWASPPPSNIEPTSSTDGACPTSPEADSSKQK